MNREGTVSGCETVGGGTRLLLAELFCLTGNLAEGRCTSSDESVTARVAASNALRCRL